MPKNAPVSPFNDLLADYWLNGHQFEQTPGDNKGQGSLAYCSSWGHRIWHDWADEQQYNKPNLLGLNTDILVLNPQTFTLDEIDIKSSSPTYLH